MAMQASTSNVRTVGCGRDAAYRLQRSSRRDRSAPVRFFAILALALTMGGLASPQARAQGSRRDDIVFGPSGHPVAGAIITVCQATATGTPCAPLATLYTDATLTTIAPNPFQADGIGNYHFYAPAGRYLIQISGPQITGTINYPDVILPADVSSSGAGNDISAFGLTLGGNLSVAGNATISGTLDVLQLQSRIANALHAERTGK